MPNILDLPPELLRTILDLILDSTRPTDRQTAQVRFLRTCRVFRAVADTRICIEIWDAGYLAYQGKKMEDWTSERCKAVELVILRDMGEYLDVVENHPTPLHKLKTLRTLVIDLEYGNYAVDYQMFSRIFGSLASLTTLDLGQSFTDCAEIDVEDVLDYLRHLPQLQSLTLPFVSFKSTHSSYSIPYHPLISLKISLRGLRGCDFFAALLPALPALRSLFLGVLPVTDYSDSVPLEEIVEFGPDLDSSVTERLAEVIDRNGAGLTTFGFGPAIPHGSWYRDHSWEHSGVRRIYDVLPTPLQHFLVTPHTHFSHQLGYLSNYFSQIRHLTLTSESLPYEPENRDVLNDGDLLDLVNFCKDSPSLEMTTFKSIGTYDAPYGVCWNDRPSCTWAEMERELAALDIVIEDVKRDGYQSD